MSTRRLNKNTYKMGLTSDDSVYIDENGKLYMYNSELEISRKLIFDAAKPDEIREDLIED